MDLAENKVRRSWGFQPLRLWSSENSWVICNNFGLCGVLGPHYCKQSELNNTINIDPIVIRNHPSSNHSEFWMREVQRALRPKAQGLQSSTAMCESPELGLSFVHESVKIHNIMHSTYGGLQVVRCWFQCVLSSIEHVFKRASYLEVIWN